MDMDATSGPDANQSRRRKPSIFVRQVLLYLVFILLVVGIAGRLFFAAARTFLEDEIDSKLESLARIATRDAPLERLDLIRVGDDRCSARCGWRSSPLRIQPPGPPHTWEEST